MKPVRLYALAEADLDAAAVHYTRESGLELGLRFYDSVESGLQRIARNPAIGSLRHSDHAALSGVRAWPVPGFADHIIFYRNTEASIEVIRILHGARDLPPLLEDSGEPSRE